MGKNGDLFFFFCISSLDVQPVFVRVLHQSDEFEIPDGVPLHTYPIYRLSCLYVM
jgi:hypothetical protein